MNCCRMYWLSLWKEFTGNGKLVLIIFTVLIILQAVVSETWKLVKGGLLCLIIRDLFHVFFFFINNFKNIVRFLIYKPGIKVLLDIML